MDIIARSLVDERQPFFKEKDKVITVTEKINKELSKTEK